MTALAPPFLLRDFIEKLLSLERTHPLPGKVHSEHDFIEKLLATVDAAPVLLAYLDVSERYRFGAFGFSFERERTFSTEELQFMESIGHQCSLAIERARLYAAERQARAEAERLRDELAAERARLEAVLRQLPVGVVIAEPDGRMVMGNAAIDSIIRRPFTLSASIPDYAMNHQGYREDGTRIAPEDWPMTRSLSHGVTVVNEPVTIRHPDGALTKVELSSTPVRDAEGRTVAGVVVVNDVTAHHELQEALRREADVREKLIGIVSHDLRSPLQAIITSGQLLLRSQPLTAPQQRWAQRIQSSTHRMGHLIRDLLDFARVRQGGTLPVQPQLIRLEEVCRARRAHPGELLVRGGHGVPRDAAPAAPDLSAV